MSSTKPSSRSSKRDKDDSNNPDLTLPSVGNYVFIKTVGEGNFAKVKLATHKITGAEVAIKIIDKTQLDDKKLSKLYREVRIMKSLHHPNIIKLYEVVETKSTVFLVMEYCSGGELYDYLVVHGKMKEREARSKFRQILSAVSYCHKKRIIHRDLKAENLLLDENLNIKIADFGFSNIFDPESKLDTFCGSPPYAAPELFQGRRYIGPEVDVWSLGVILYVLTTGCLPFDGKNLQEMRESVCRGKYRIPFYLSDGCERLLRKFLVRDPLRRAGLEIVIDDTWINESYGDSPITTDLSEKIEEDENIFKLLESKYQVPREDIIRSIRENLYNDIAATYYLMYHEKDVRNQIQSEVERGEVTPSPFGSMVGSPSSSMSRKKDKDKEKNGSSSGSGIVSKSGMGRIDEDSISNSVDASKSPSSSSKVKSSRRRRVTVGADDRPEDSSGASTPSMKKKDDKEKDKEREKDRDKERDREKDKERSGSREKERDKDKEKSKRDKESGSIEKSSKTDVTKGDQTPQSPSGGRIERKRNNTIVGILRDRIRRPSELGNPISPSSDKGNLDVLKSGTLGSSTIEDGSSSNIKPGDENKPRSLRFTFNSNTTSSKAPEDIIAEVIKACTKMAASYKLTSKYVIECAWNNPASTKETSKIEIEVCKLPRLNNLHGLKFKRVAGGSSDYKELCEKLLGLIQL